jgi:hypothetical protein
MANANQTWGSPRIHISMPTPAKNVHNMLGTNAVTRPVDELTDAALIYIVWNFGV